MTANKSRSSVPLLFKFSCFILLALVPRCVLSQSGTINSCKDDSTYSFGNYNYDGYTYTRTCAWITDTPVMTDTRKETWCRNSKKYEGITVANICPKTCDKCSTGIRNRQPILGEGQNCNDDQSFTFGSYTYNGDKYDRSCKWMTITPMKKMFRKEKWCSRRWGSTEIRDKCPSVCNDACLRRRGRNIRKRSL